MCSESADYPTKAAKFQQQFADAWQASGKVCVCVGVGLGVLWCVGLPMFLLRGVKLDCRSGVSFATVQVQRLNVLLYLSSCEVLRHEVSGFGRALDLHELHGPAEGLLL